MPLETITCEWPCI